MARIDVSMLGDLKTIPFVCSALVVSSSKMVFNLIVNIFEFIPWKLK